MCVYVYICVYNKIYARLIKWCVLSFSLNLSRMRASHHLDVHINTKPSPERRRKCVSQTQKRSFSAVTSREIGSSIKLCSNSPSNRGGFELSSICLPFRGLATRARHSRFYYHESPFE